MFKTISIAALALIGSVSANPYMSLKDYTSDMKWCYQDLKKEHLTDSQAKITKALTDEIDWQLNMNWSVKVPQDQKGRVRVEMIQKFSPLVSKLAASYADHYGEVNDYV